MDEVTIEEVIEIGNQIMGIKFVIINTPVTIQRVLDLCLAFFKLRIDIRTTSFNIEFSLFEFKTKFGIGAYNEGI